MRKHKKSEEKGRTRDTKNRMRLATAAPALSMAGFGLTGCDREAKETVAGTETADRQAGGAQAANTQTNGDQAEGGQEGGSWTADDKKYKMALYLSGAINGMGWCQSAHDGLKLLEADYGCEVTYTGNLALDDTEATFAGYVASGYGVITGHRHEFRNSAVDVTEQYLDTKFIITERETSADNVVSYVSKCEEGGYIMGILATGMFESGKVSFIGPIQGASLMKIVNGFEGRAEEINPDIQVQTTWAGSFIDTTLGKGTAQAMTDNDADVIGRCANESGTGAINAAKGTKAYTIGDPYDQDDLAPDIILSSSVYHIPHMIEIAFKTVADGTFEGGINQLGVAGEAVSVAPYHNLDSAVPNELKQKISDRIATIKSETFEVTCDTKSRTQNIS